MTTTQERPAAPAPAEQTSPASAPEPVGTVHIVDPSPLNWLFITWNTMEEPIRVDEDGRVVHALAESHRWVDDRTLEMTIRTGVRFQDGSPCTSHSIKQNFEEMQRWPVPHPPGTWLNFPVTTRVDCPDDQTIVFRFPEPDGLAIAKFRGFHVASPGFWEGPDAPGFGYKKFGSGDGHW